MGLDNIPNTYPCKAAGTAVMVTQTYEDGSTADQIDCEATQACGGCPWKNANPPTEGRVYGMLGTDCWYRGKWGNHLISTFFGSDTLDNFYGDSEDGTEKSPESCLHLADMLKGAISTYGHDHLLSDEERETKKGLIYAEWYLRWAAAETDGLVCWY